MTIKEHLNVKCTGQKTSNKEIHFLQLNDTYELKTSDDDVLTQLQTLDGNLVDVETILNNQTTELEAIKNNTADLDINTDGIETSLTTLNGKIDTLTTQATGGSEKVNILGNTEGDGSGDAKSIHTDGSGNVLTQVVNTLNIAPSNSSNSHVTDDPANSLACGMKARTTIGSSNTETFLKCSSQGILEINNSKITQGEGSITGGGDGLMQILAYGKDQSGNLDPLNVDSQGHLKITVNDIESGINASLPVEEKKEWQTIATLSSSLSVPNGGNNDSAVVSNNKQTDFYIVQIECDDNTYTDYNAELHESIDASNYKLSREIMQGMTPSFFIFENIDRLAPNWKIRVNNTGLSTKTFTIKYVKA